MRVGVDALLMTKYRTREEFAGTFVLLPIVFPIVVPASLLEIVRALDAVLLTARQTRVLPRFLKGIAATNEAAKPDGIVHVTAPVPLHTRIPATTAAAVIFDDVLNCVAVFSSLSPLVDWSPLHCKL